MIKTEVSQLASVWLSFVIYNPGYYSNYLSCVIINVCIDVYNCKQFLSYDLTLL